ncbi:MAG: hypothetical protein JWR69_4357 [Pedosphaera sp.]|nr:hypothetical protein [Pedosphaera sp.]
MNASGDPFPACAELLGRYAEPHRAYHDFKHIQDCLGEFGAASHLAADKEAIEMAIWYHDAVYDSRAKDNEEQSADLAEKAGKTAGLPSMFLARVRELILATKHVTPPEDMDAALLVDVDLSILGQSAGKFDEYENQIRREYAWVENEAFRAGRSTILKSFLQRPSIYWTEFFREKYEKSARENLARSIARLQGAPR